MHLRDLGIGNGASLSGGEHRGHRQKRLPRNLSGFHSLIHTTPKLTGWAETKQSERDEILVPHPGRANDDRLFRHSHDNNRNESTRQASRADRWARSVL